MTCFTLNLYPLCRKDHEKAEFEVHEVYAVDVLISTGEGKVRASSPHSPVSLTFSLSLRLKHTPFNLG